MTNALVEGVIGLYKTECIRTAVFHAGPYRTIADSSTAGWVDRYNNGRLPSSLNNMAPAEHEAAHYATVTGEPQTVRERKVTWDASNASNFCGILF